MLSVKRMNRDFNQTHVLTDRIYQTAPQPNAVHRSAGQEISWCSNTYKTPPKPQIIIFTFLTFLMLWANRKLPLKTLWLLSWCGAETLHRVLAGFCSCWHQTEWTPLASSVYLRWCMRKAVVAALQRLLPHLETIRTREPTLACESESTREMMSLKKNLHRTDCTVSSLHCCIKPFYHSNLCSLNPNMTFDLSVLKFKYSITFYSEPLQFNHL